MTRNNNKNNIIFAYAILKRICKDTKNIDNENFYANDYYSKNTFYISGYLSILLKLETLIKKEDKLYTELWHQFFNVQFWDDIMLTHKNTKEISAYIFNIPGASYEGERSFSMTEQFGHLVLPLKFFLEKIKSDKYCPKKVDKNYMNNIIKHGVKNEDKFYIQSINYNTEIKNNNLFFILYENAIYFLDDHFYLIINDNEISMETVSEDTEYIKPIDSDVNVLDLIKIKTYRDFLINRSKKNTFSRTILINMLKDETFDEFYCDGSIDELNFNEFFKINYSI